MCLAGKHPRCGGHFITLRKELPLRPPTKTYEYFQKSRKKTEIEKLNFRVVKNEDEERRGGCNGEAQSVRGKAGDAKKTSREVVGGTEDALKLS